jgi:hypothetical protein
MTESIEVEPDEAPGELVPFLAQVSSGDACAEGRYLMAGIELSPGVMPFPVVLDLMGLEPCGFLPVCLDHDPRKQAGVVEVAWVEGSQLLASGVVDGGLEHGAAVIRSHRHGTTWRISIGVGHTISATILSKGNTVINSRAFSGPLLVVTRWSLKEVSLTTRPADKDTLLILPGSRPPGPPRPPVVASSREPVHEETLPGPDPSRNGEPTRVEGVPNPRDPRAG